MQTMEYMYRYAPGEEKMIAQGDMDEMMAMIGRQINLLYTRILRQNAEAASDFRYCITAMCMDPASPVWEKKSLPSGKGVECFIVREK